MAEDEDWIIEWREQVGIKVMHAMTCTHHGTEAFGTRAVCVTCFESTQRIGALIEHLSAAAWERGRAAERRDWELTADLAAPDEERRPETNPYRSFDAERCDQPPMAEDATPHADDRNEAGA